MSDYWKYTADGKSRRSMASHVRKNVKRMFVNGKYISQSHPLWKPGRYKSFNDAAFSSLQNYSRTREGHVYVIVNSAWPEWVKVGMAIDVEDRCGSYQTSSPFRDYQVLYSYASDDRRLAESLAHKCVAAVSDERRGEWFKVDSSMAVTELQLHSGYS